jgi:hypothetical protein
MPPPDVVVDIDDIPTPATVRRSIAERQEDARRIITYILLGIFGVEVLLSLVMVWCIKRTGMVEDLKQIMTIIFGPTAALVGSATGFYFATKSETNQGQPNTPRTPP